MTSYNTFLMGQAAAELDSRLSRPDMKRARAETAKFFATYLLANENQKPLKILSIRDLDPKPEPRRKPCNYNAILAFGVCTLIAVYASFIAAVATTSALNAQESSRQPMTTESVNSTTWPETEYFNPQP